MRIPGLPHTLQLSAALILGAAVLVALVGSTGLARVLDRSLMSPALRLRPSPEGSGRVSVVLLRSSPLEAHHLRLREELGSFLTALAAQQDRPAAVVVDVLLSEPPVVGVGRSQPDIDAVVSASAAMGNVVHLFDLSTRASEYAGDDDLLPLLEPFSLPSEGARAMGASGARMPHPSHARQLASAAAAMGFGNYSVEDKAGVPGAFTLPLLGVGVAAAAQWPSRQGRPLAVPSLVLAAMSVVECPASALRDCVRPRDAYVQVGEVQVPVTEEGRLEVNYRQRFGLSPPVGGPAGARDLLRWTSAPVEGRLTDRLGRPVGLGEMAGRVLLIADGQEQAVVETPLGAGFPGGAVHAHALATLVERDFVHHPDGQVVWFLGCSLLSLALMARLLLFRGLGVGYLAGRAGWREVALTPEPWLALLWIAVAWSLFNTYSVVLPLAAPGAALLGGAIGWSRRARRLVSHEAEAAMARWERFQTRYSEVELLLADQERALAAAREGAEGRSSEQEQRLEALQGELESARKECEAYRLRSLEAEGSAERLLTELTTLKQGHSTEDGSASPKVDSRLHQALREMAELSHRAVMDRKTGEAYLESAGRSGRPQKARPGAAVVNAELKASTGLSTGHLEWATAVVDFLKTIARTHQPALLLGPTGTGKTRLARIIHDRSSRAGGPFVAVNCASLRAETAQSVLQGHRRGAFTGATGDYEGLFSQAHQGTLFLDEVAELSHEVQAMLLTLVQDGVVTALGGDARRSRRVDVRIITATNQDLEERVRLGRFREDLFYRLSVFSFTLWPLSERVGDASLLMTAMLKDNHRKLELDLDESARLALDRHDWPGNVRELEAVAARLIAAAEAEAPILTARDVAAALRSSSLPGVAQLEPRDLSEPLRDSLRRLRRHQFVPNRVEVLEGVARGTLNNHLEILISMALEQSGWDVAEACTLLVGPSGEGALDSATQKVEDFINKRLPKYRRDRSERPDFEANLTRNLGRAGCLLIQRVLEAEGSGMLRG